MRCARCYLLAVAWLLLGPTGARAEFALVEDFETCLPGPIDGQNEWSAVSYTSAVTVDPGPAAPENQVLQVATDSTWLYHSMLLPEEARRVLFLRFRFDDQSVYSLGLSDLTYPSQFHDFEVELSMSNVIQELRVNDGGTYEVLATLLPDVWYNCWLVIDNTRDETQVFLHARDGEGASVADRLASNGQVAFDFRGGNAGDLLSFFIKTGGGSGSAGLLYLDDLYLETTDASNLSNPTSDAVPAPAAGRVPSQPEWIGDPLRIDKYEDGLLSLSWDFSCLASDTDYEVYEGILGQFGSHMPVLCTTQGQTSAIVEPAHGDRYFLIVPANSEREGSYGADGQAYERFPSAAPCRPQRIGECL